MKYFNLNDSLGYYFSKSYSLFKNAYNKLLKARGYDLNSDHWTILIILKNNPGIKQSAIAKIMQRDKPYITRIVDYLEKSNHVQRRPDPSDRRAHNVFLTQEGEKLFSELLILAEELNSVVTQGVNEQEILVMKNTLSQLIEQMFNYINKY